MMSLWVPVVRRFVRHAVADEVLHVHAREGISRLQAALLHFKHSGASASLSNIGVHLAPALLGIEHHERRSSRLV